jgi:hypothetical protein
MKPYPDSRVIGGFTFAPLVGVILMLLYLVFKFIFFIFEGASFDGFMLKMLLFVVTVGSFFAELIFGIPAFLFGWIYARLKLERTPSAFIIITLISFIGTALYVAMLFCLFDSEISSVKGHHSLTETLPTIFTASGLATLSSWIVAWRVLPKRGELSQE